MDASSAKQQMLWTSSAQVASVLQAMAEARHAEAIRIGQVIAHLRELKGWNQQDLAHEISVHVSTVSRWEQGKHKGYGSNIRSLAAALGVEPSVLTPATDLVIGSQLDRIETAIKQLDDKLSAFLVETAAVDVEEQTPPAVKQPPKRDTRRQRRP